MSLTFVQRSLETSRGSSRCWGWAAPASQWTTSAPAPSGLLLWAPCAGQHRTSSPSSHVCPELTELCYHAYALCSDDVGKEGRAPSFDCFCWISLIWMVLLFQLIYQWLLCLSTGCQLHFTICVPLPRLNFNGLVALYMFHFVCLYSVLCEQWRSSDGRQRRQMECVCVSAWVDHSVRSKNWQMFYYMGANPIWGQTAHPNKVGNP